MFTFDTFVGRLILEVSTFADAGIAPTTFGVVVTSSCAVPIALTR